MTTQLVLHAERLTKRYGRRAALLDCDLAIPRRHIVGLVGRTAPASRPSCNWPAG